jgi:hypothetical protein
MTNDLVEERENFLSLPRNEPDEPLFSWIPSHSHSHKKHASQRLSTGKSNVKAVGNLLLVFISHCTPSPQTMAAIRRISIETISLLYYYVRDFIFIEWTSSVIVSKGGEWKL